MTWKIKKMADILQHGPHWKQTPHIHLRINVMRGHAQSSHTRDLSTTSSHPSGSPLHTVTPSRRSSPSSTMMPWRIEPPVEFVPCFWPNMLLRLLQRQCNLHNAARATWVGVGGGWGGCCSLQANVASVSGSVWIDICSPRRTPGWTRILGVGS